MDNSFRRDVRNYPLYFLLWTIFGLFYFSQGLTQRLVSHDVTPWWRYLVAWLIGVYIWALLTPAIFWLGRRFPIERHNWLRRSALQLLFSAGFSVFELAAEDALYAVLRLFPSTRESFLPVFARSVVRGFHGGILNYWIVLGLQWGVLYYRQYRARSQEVLEIQLGTSELQSQLVSAQLNALKMLSFQPPVAFPTRPLLRLRAVLWNGCLAGDEPGCAPAERKTPSRAFRAERHDSGHPGAHVPHWPAHRIPQRKALGFVKLGLSLVTDYRIAEANDRAVSGRCLRCKQTPSLFQCTCMDHRGNVVVGWNRFQVPGFS
jgi:hypothetical protein